MAEGNFHERAWRFTTTKGAIHWTRTQDEARAALVDAMGEGQRRRARQIPLRVRLHQRRRGPAQRRLARRAQAARRAWGERRDPSRPSTGAPISPRGDRIQFTGTDKKHGTLSTARPARSSASTATDIAVRLDGRGGQRASNSTPRNFKDFRHGYAGTIYKGPGPHPRPNLSLSFGTLAIGGKLCRA